MSKIYRIEAVFSYFCVAENEEEALEEFANYCEVSPIRAGDFDDIYFNGVAREVPEDE